MGVYLERARLLFRQVRYDLAEGELLRELAADPDNALAHALLGLCRGRLQRYPEAVASCREAVRLGPDSAYVHYALAYILDDCDRLAEASDAIGEALRLDPADADYFALLAYVRSRQQRYKESLTAAEHGLRLDPSHVHCLNRRAMALAYMRRPEEAEQVIRTALSHDPHNAVTLANFGWVLLEQQKPTPALEQLREALRLDPRLGWARQKTVDALVLLVEQGLAWQALRHFPDAVGRDPDLEPARQRLVRALMGRVPEPLDRALEAAWLAGCFLTLGPEPRPHLVGLLFGLLLLYLYAFPRRFVLLDPLYWLFLRLGGLGRRVLAPNQLWAATQVGLCLGGAVVSATAAIVTGSPRALMAAVLFQSLTLPAAWLHACPAGPARRGMRAYFLLIAVTGLATLTLAGSDGLPWDEAAGIREILFLMGAGATGLVGRALLYWYHPKRARG